MNRTEIIDKLREQGFTYCEAVNAVNSCGLNYDMCLSRSEDFKAKCGALKVTIVPSDLQGINQFLSQEKFKSAIKRDEMVLRDPKTGEITNNVLILEGSNGKPGDDKGRNRSYLNLIFSLDGKLERVEVYSPSQDELFSYFDARTGGS